MHPLHSIFIFTAASVWMFYCIEFRRKPISLIEVLMICGENQKT